VQPPLPAAALSAATWFRAVQPPSRLQQTAGRRRGVTGCFQAATPLQQTARAAAAATLPTLKVWR
jgi:hypothetical protein